MPGRREGRIAHGRQVSPSGERRDPAWDGSEFEACHEPSRPGRILSVEVLIDPEPEIYIPGREQAPFPPVASFETGAVCGLMLTPLTGGPLTVGSFIYVYVQLNELRANMQPDAFVDLELAPHGKVLDRPPLTPEVTIVAWAAKQPPSGIGPRLRVQHKLGIRIKVVAVEVVRDRVAGGSGSGSDRSETSDGAQNELTGVARGVRVGRGK